VIIPLTDDEKSKVIGSYDQIYEIMRRILMYEDEAGRTREHFWGIGFQTLDHIKYIELVALGTMNKVYVSPRELFQLAVTLNCPRVLVVHNHPSGSLRFSAADTRLTRRLIDAGDLMDIEIVDHLLITLDDGYKSALYGNGKSPFTGATK
jgi:DNA repair protein RadC